MKRISFLVLTSVINAQAADIAWSSGVVTEESVVSNHGALVEACNFGNSGTTAPTVNGVPFKAVDFTSGESPSSLIGLTYNTGEDGKLAGPGVNELSDTIAYQSGVDPQTASLTGLTVGTEYEVQFFYYHSSVNRSVTIRDKNGNKITLSETGEPLFATGTFTADSTTQELIFDANVGSQFLNAYQLRESTPVPPLVLGKVVISEFMASNNGALNDGDGNHSDWIEIWNSTDEPLPLQGWALTDDPSDLNKWSFPEITLEPNDYLLVFATGQVTNTYVDSGGFRHTNFKLDKAAGGYLALVNNDMEIVDQFTSYPEQVKDTSFGLHGNEAPLSEGYLETATPRKKNIGLGFIGIVGDTAFDQDRGFYDAPFKVRITSPTNDAKIRYTIDGSEPTESNGNDYPGGSGISITGTTVLRAAAFMHGHRPTNVDTHTYLFVDVVVNQSASPPGFPTTWTGSDYAMENNPAHLALIAGDSGFGETEAKTIISDALLELPVMSLSMHVDDWFSPTRGIYHNSQARGRSWERACSAELIHPPGVDGEGNGDFQIDCGIRVQGFTSRDPVRNPKHSLRLAFRSQYGDSKLRYQFFGNDAPDNFDTIVLRSNSQDAWVYNTTANRAGQFVRDAWARKTHREMGHFSPDSNWVHLFINGLYWGVYNPTERPDSSYSAAYYGGDKEDYDSIKNHEEPLDGTIDAYKHLLSLIQNDPNNFSAGYRDLSGTADYEDVLETIDVDMLIDYMIHNMYAAATDWPGNNYMGYDRTGAHGGWRFYDWDNEHGMKHSVSTNRTTTHRRDNDSPTKFHHALRSNADYRQRFGDRLHKAMFNGGALYVDPANPTWDPANPERNVPATRWMELTGEIETALIAEAARWGDYRKATPYTVFNEFQSVRNNLLQNWFPTRSTIVLGQFRSQGLYPNFAAPEFDQFGGVVATGSLLSMTAPDGGTIHYTLDGSDPKDSDKNYSAPVPLRSTGEVKARVKLGSEWSALTSASFVVGHPASADNLAITEIMYHPVGGTSHEYLELINLSATPIDLTGVKFTAGISFEFPTGTTVGPGERVLVVKNLDSFGAQYGEWLPVAGQYTGKLDNGGEQIVLEDLEGEMIQRFSYGDDSPWPETPDGQGSSLVLVAPENTPGYSSNPFNWRPSVTSGGSPGGTDSVFFTGSATDDLDSDTISALLEHALGSSDTFHDQSVLPTVGRETFSIPDSGALEEFLTFTFRRNLAADDMIYLVETSSDALTWNSDPGKTVFVSSKDLGGGIALITYRCSTELRSEKREFMRLKVSLR